MAVLLRSFQDNPTLILRNKRQFNDFGNQEVWRLACGGKPGAVLQVTEMAKNAVLSVEFLHPDFYGVAEVVEITLGWNRDSSTGEPTHCVVIDGVSARDHLDKLRGFVTFSDLTPGLKKISLRRVIHGVSTCVYTEKHALHFS